MPSYEVDHVEPWGGAQLTIWLKDRDGRTEDAEGLGLVVTLAAADVPGFIQDVVGAYAVTMQNLAIHLAAGGCRTCGGERMVRAPGDGLFDRSVPCPVCLPRADERLRRRVFRRAAARAR